MSLPDPWRFCRTAEAAHYAHTLADAPRRPLAIFGRRDIGKTHFLTHDLTEEAIRRGWCVVYADLWGQPDPLRAINTALASALSAVQTRNEIPPETPAGAPSDAHIAPPTPLPANAEPVARLATLFAELRRLQSEQPVLVMLDEAQTLVRPGAGEAAIKAIHAVFNTNPGAILMLFSGSSKAQLMSLAGDHRKTAFKLAAHVDLPMLGMGFVSFIAARIKLLSGRELPTDELDWSFNQLLHRPGEMINFANFLVEDMPRAAIRDALHEFKHRTRPDASYQALYEHCTPLQRAVLIEVAAQSKLFAKDTRDRIGTAIGQLSPVAPASVHSTLEHLEAQTILAKRLTRGQYVFEDEQLRDWIHQVAVHAPGDMADPNR